MDIWSELSEFVRQNRPSQEELIRAKVRIAGIHKLRRIPSNFEIMLHAKPSELSWIKRYLKTKPMRTMSGIAVVAIMAKPRRCPHGKCVMCPGGPESYFGDMPQSYTGKEPATRRAIRNHFDPYLQVFNRLEQYTVLGHNVEKIELIIMGGTFTAYPKEYQKEFVTYAFKAMNDFSKLFMRATGLNIQKFKHFFELPGNIVSPIRINRLQKRILKLKGKSELIKEQKRNEHARVRCVALCLETRPDYCKPPHIQQMLELGCTRVELGVQATSNSLLQGINRGHTVEDAISATKALREAFLKVGYHIMIGLPGSTPSGDVAMFKQLFQDSRFRPDFLKIYPCLVVKGTRLYELWKQGKYKPLTVMKAAEIIYKLKKYVPEYTRIMRIQRDIPEQVIEAGPKLSNLRQYVLSMHPKCRCIRCREYGFKIKAGVKVNLHHKQYRITRYQAAGGTEYFIQCEDPSANTLLGFCRLRINGKRAGIRELHVYGQVAGIGKQGKVQHTGIGKTLVRMAEKIASGRLCIISGVGVRDYYRKLGYRKEGYYMVKI